MRKRRFAMLLLVLTVCAVLIGCTQKEEVFVRTPVETTAPAMPEVETFVVHAYVPEAWEGVFCWTSSKNEDEVFPVWPGVEMIPDGGGWYTCELPEWAEELVLIGKSGEHQSGVLEIEAQEQWIGIEENGTIYLDYFPYEMPQGGGYIEEVPGDYEGVYIKDNNLDINAQAFVFTEPVLDCYEMTLHMNAEMLAGTKCKDWQVWLRINGEFVKFEKVHLEAGGGYHYETYTFDDPISFDAVAITATVPGGYSYYMGIAVTDVWTVS